MTRHIIWWWALVSLAMLTGTGCDRPGSGPDQPWGHTGSDTALSEAVPIRVLLLKTNQTQLACADAAAELWIPSDPQQATTRRPIARLATDMSYSVSRKNGLWQLSDRSGANILTANAATAKTLELRPKPNGLLKLGTTKLHPYRGIVRLVAYTDDLLAVVNILDMESYLQGVVGSEMPAYWYKAALRAQCIAARTYALYQMHNHNKNKDWDINSDQSSQVYGGVDKESRRVSQAIRETRGIVLAYGDQDDEKIFPAYYSSTCGGHTANGAEVFGDSLPPLHGRKCPYCGSVAPPKYYRWPTVQIAKRTVSDKLIKRYPVLKQTLKQVANIKISTKTESGRIEKIELIGSNQRRQYIGVENFRLAITTREQPVRSSWFRLVDAGDDWRFENGKGWGHGVGLCQTGCQQMAKEGNDCVAMLEFYYPRATLLRVY